MKYARIRSIKKLYFGYEEIAGISGISRKSAVVSAARLVKSGLLLRLKRNLYILKERWDNLEREEGFILANLIQSPSYISFMTALDYYEITTQMQRDFIESAAIKRTKEVDIESHVFKYTKIDKRLYSGFSRRNGFFIATPEKAFLDILYLVSLRRYKFDPASLDLNKLDIKKLKMLAAGFPQKTKRLLDSYGRLTKA